MEKAIKAPFSELSDLWVFNFAPFVFAFPG
jgi:hypothetical protein